MKSINRIKNILVKKNVLVIELIIFLNLIILLKDYIYILYIVLYYILSRLLHRLFDLLCLKSGIDTNLRFPMQQFYLFKSILQTIIHYRIVILLLGSLVSISFFSPPGASLIVLLLGLFLNILGEFNRLINKICKNHIVTKNKIFYFKREDILKMPIKAILHISGPTNTGYQLKQWLPFLEEIYESNQIIVIIRQAHFARDCSDSNIPMLYIRAKEYKKLRDLVQEINPQNIYYVNNSAYNCHLTAMRQYCHIHLNHGDSDKGPNALGTSKDMDFVFVAGEAAKRRYQNAGWSSDKIILIGRPQIDSQLLRKNRTSISDKNNLSILYAPTFEGAREYDCYSSLVKMGQMIVDTIMNQVQCSLTFKPHPYTGQYVIAYKEAMNRIRKKFSVNEKKYRFIEKSSTDNSLYDLFEQCDVLIGDVSSVCIDFLATGKPIIATNPFGLSMNDEVFNIIPFWKAAYVIGCEDNAKLIDLIQNIQKGIDPMKEIREEVAKYYFGQDFRDRESIKMNFIKAADRATQKKKKDCFYEQKIIPTSLLTAL